MTSDHSTDLPEIPFAGWTLVKPIGEGSSGTVYLAEKTTDGKTERSAVKVISFPRNRAELEALRSEGITSEGAKKYYIALAEKYSSEISLMESLRECDNVVRIEDQKTVMRDDGMGFDLFIRMEYLTPVIAVTEFGALPEAEIVKMGRDVCRALESCGSIGVIHRDVKPENIFIDDKGNYKLGDFGIARVTGENTYGMTNVGTRNYMAPEVAAGTGYDRRADIYSLGLTMYRLGNGGKLPFIDTDSQLIDPAARIESVERRLGGEAIPAPKGISQKLRDIILKACAFRPSDRYSTPAEMREALEGRKRKIGPARLMYLISAAALAASVAIALSASALNRNERSLLSDDPGSYEEETDSGVETGVPVSDVSEKDGKETGKTGKTGKTDKTVAKDGKDDKDEGSVTPEEHTGNETGSENEKENVPGESGTEPETVGGKVAGTSVVITPPDGKTTPTDSGNNGTSGGGQSTSAPSGSSGKKPSGNVSGDSGKTEEPSGGGSADPGPGDDPDDVFEPSPYDLYYPADGTSFADWLASLGPVSGHYEKDDYDGVWLKTQNADPSVVKITDEVVPSLYSSGAKTAYLYPSVGRCVERLFDHTSITDVYYAGSSALFSLIPPTAGTTTPVYTLHTVEDDSEKLLMPQKVFESSVFAGQAQKCFDKDRNTGFDFDWDGALKNSYGQSDYSTFPQDYVAGDGSYHKKVMSVDPARYYFGALFGSTRNVDLVNVIYYNESGTDLTKDMLKIEYTLDGSSWTEVSSIGTSVYPAADSGGGFKSARFAFGRVAAKGIRISFKKVVSKYCDNVRITDVYLCDFSELGGGGTVDRYVFR